MPKYYYGELGYQPEGEFEVLADAEKAAVDHSIASGIAAITIWDQSDDVVSVVIEGVIFDKRSK